MNSSTPTRDRGHRTEHRIPSSVSVQCSKPLVHWASASPRERRGVAPTRPGRRRARASHGAGATGGSGSRRSWRAVGLLAAWYLGLVVPRLEWNDGMGAEIHDSGLMRVSVSVTNAGVVPVTVLGAGRSDPGVELLRVRGPHSRPPSSPARAWPWTCTTSSPTATRVPDAGPAGAGAGQRWWGRQTVEVQTRVRPDGSVNLVDHICDPQ